MKTYGKEPESLESIIAVFASDLADFAIDQVMLAIKIHAQRSQEFPTPADVVGLIRRKGKPPLSREVFIAISRKLGEDRTPDDWEYLREYESELMGETPGFADRRQGVASQQEIDRLRSEVRELRVENERLALLLRESRVAKGVERPQLSVQQKVEATAQEMRRGGASEEDISAFLRQHHAEAA